MRFPVVPPDIATSFRYLPVESPQTCAWLMFALSTTRPPHRTNGPMLFFTEIAEPNAKFVGQGDNQPSEGRAGYLIYLASSETFANIKKFVPCVLVLVFAQLPLGCSFNGTDVEVEDGTNRIVSPRHR